MDARRGSPGLIAAAFVVLAAAGRALAADPDPDPDLGAPSVCVPPCASGEICVGSACVAPDLRPRRPARPPAPAPVLPAAPRGSAPTTGPQPDSVPAPTHAPAQPSSAQAPPAPAYVPPPGYPAAPPPGYYYAPPPGYAYPPAVYAPVPRPPRTKRAFLVLPQLGMHSFQNRAAGSYDPGVRVGSIVGGRFNDRVSLDADMTFDVSNVHGVAPGDSFSEWTFALAICSLFQMPVGPLEVLTGPKGGYAFGRAERRLMGVTEQDRTTSLLVGLDAGVFMPVSPKTSLGVLLSLELRFPQHVCRRTTGFEVCSPGAQSDGNKIVGLSAGALF